MEKQQQQKYMVFFRPSKRVVKSEAFKAFVKTHPLDKSMFTASFNFLCESEDKVNEMIDTLKSFGKVNKRSLVAMLIDD